MTLIKNEGLVRHIHSTGIGLLAILILSSCSPDPIAVPIDEGIGALPEVVIDPPDNPTTPEKVELGRMLFWDPILSGNFDVACATCHHPDHGWGDDLRRSRGVGGAGLAQNRVGGAPVARNAPTIINTAFNGIDVDGIYDPANTVMFWDNRSSSLEQQSLDPIRSMPEMRGGAYPADQAISVVSQRLAEVDEYVQLFESAFGAGVTIDGDKISKAIAAYERTIIANNSPFDQYARGDDEALTAQEIRGMNAFLDMRCNACHSGPMFSDYELHDLGVPDLEGPNQGPPDNGVDGQFRTPTLRNLPETGPYFHNGVFDDLTASVEFYDDFEVNGEAAEQLEFNEDDEVIAAVVAFLQALHDPNVERSVPTRVPSGLQVGGDID